MGSHFGHSSSQSHSLMNVATQMVTVNTMWNYIAETSQPQNHEKQYIIVVLGQEVLDEFVLQKQKVVVEVGCCHNKSQNVVFSLELVAGSGWRVAWGLSRGQKNNEKIALGYWKKSRIW